MYTRVLLLAILTAGCGGSGDDAASGATIGSGDDAASGATIGSGDDAASGATSGPGSSGCGQAPSLTPDTWSLQTLTVGGTARQYAVRLPKGYDPVRRYPVVYELHGCGSPDNDVPIENQSKEEALLVRGRAIGSCWDSSDKGPDVSYIDAMIATVEQSLCVDTGRRFLAGYSSGSFMTHVLGCTHGSMLRGVASIAGGQAGSSCTGNVAALLIHDTDDGTVSINQSIAARDGYVARNQCNATGPMTPYDPSPCQAYSGCASGLPVVWCQTSGHGHDRQDSLSAPAFWHFFSGLGPR